MYRKALSLFEEDNHSHPSQIYHSENILHQKARFKRSDKKLDSFKWNHLHKSSLSDLRSSLKTHANTIFSSRLFDKAHRIQPSLRETYIPQTSQNKADQDKKIRDVYETYLRINKKEKSTSTEASKKKGLSLADKDHNVQDTAVSDSNGNQPFTSSLTKIVMDQCHLALPENHQQLEASDWGDILCEIQSTEVEKKLGTRGSGGLPDNPYELLPIRRRGPKKENREWKQDNYKRKARGR